MQYLRIGGTCARAIIWPRRGSMRSAEPSGAISSALHAPAARSTASPSTRSPSVTRPRTPARLAHKGGQVAAGVELGAGRRRRLRVGEHETLVVEPVVALDEDGVTDLRRQRRLEGLDVGAFQHLDAEFLVEGPRIGVVPRLGSRHRIDRAAGDVLDVDARPALELVDGARIEPPAGKSELREVRVGRLTERRQEAR